MVSGSKYWSFLPEYFGMGREVEVGATVNAFQLLETEGEVELNVGGGVGVVGQLLVIVETIFLSRQT